MGRYDSLIAALIVGAVVGLAAELFGVPVALGVAAGGLLGTLATMWLTLRTLGHLRRHRDAGFPRSR